MRSLLLLILLACWSCSAPKKEEGLRLNAIQVIGSHNSYKQAIEPPVLNMLLARDSNAIGMDYHHISLKEQLDLGIRGLEIDVLHDPVGGRYQQPAVLTMMKQKGAVTLPYDSLHELQRAGLKVLHEADIDFRSHCLTFIGCLSELKEWSAQNPDHLPIIITINPKTSGRSEPGFTKVLPFTTNVLDSLDQEILSVFPSSKLITPDQVKGTYPSLREAVTKGGWPLMEACKGKMLFVLDAGQEITGLYLQSSREGKTMFVNVAEDHPEAAFFILNEPQQQLAQIQKLVQAGFMVRTRADANTVEARKGDYTRLNAAVASGAQVISTDYYLAKLSPTGNFQISFEGGKYVHCNPLISTAGCGL